MLNGVFPEHDIKSANDIYEIASKILCYPYELHKHAFNPVGAPNTWPYVVAFFDWLTEYLGHIAIKQGGDVILEEEIEDERRRTSMDEMIHCISAQSYSNLSNVPLIDPKSRFMKYIGKFRARQAYEQSKNDIKSQPTK